MPCHATFLKRRPPCMKCGTRPATSSSHWIAMDTMLSSRPSGEREVCFSSAILCPMPPVAATCQDATVVSCSSPSNLWIPPEPRSQAPERRRWKPVGCLNCLCCGKRTGMNFKSHILPTMHFTCLTPPLSERCMKPLAFALHCTMQHCWFVCQLEAARQEKRHCWQIEQEEKGPAQRKSVSW